MDISAVVSYDQPYRLELVHPVSGEPLGIVFEVLSAESETAKKIAREQIDEAVAERAKGAPAAAVATKAERRELKRVATLSVGWDWGEHDYHGEKPALSVPKAIEVLEAQSWIYAQVKAATEDLANFTGASPSA